MKVFQQLIKIFGLVNLQAGDALQLVQPLDSYYDFIRVTLQALKP